MKIKFGTDGWRAVIARDFTFENLARVTDAVARYAHEQAQVLLQPIASVAVGYDCRFNGRLFAEAVADRLSGQGIRVYISPGFVSTPMVSLATAQKQCTLGVVITASHNPAEYSGFKVKGHFGGPAFPDAIAKIESYIPDSPLELHRYLTIPIEYYDMEALYINHLKQSFDIARIRKSVVELGYDAMYGAGQRVFIRLFPQVRALHCEYNPLFGDCPPEPIERNLEEFADLIKTLKLNFGLATDGDADRIGLLNEKGEFVDSHHILLLLIHYLYKYKGLKGKVVCTFSCTQKIAEMCKRYELPLEITKIGFKYIGEIMAREDVLVGGEESGGIAIKGHIPERDGIYVGLSILEFMTETGKSLSELVAEVYSVVGEFWVDRSDLHVSEEIKARIISECPAYQSFGAYTIEKIENLDGYKYHLGNGRWVMIRPSGTEPVLRVYAEAENKTAAAEIISVVTSVILGE